MFNEVGDSSGGKENDGGTNDQGNLNNPGFKGGSSKTTIVLLALGSCCISLICAAIAITLFTISAAKSNILEKTLGKIIGEELCEDAKK